MEFHHISSILDTLTKSLNPNAVTTWKIVLPPVSSKCQKDFEEFLAFKKEALAAQAKKEDEEYQKEIKKRLKLVTMIGGQIYKRIADRKMTLKKVK